MENTKSQPISPQSRAPEPQTPDECLNPSPRRADYAEWMDWTNALAGWVLKKIECGEMSVGGLACVFDVVEFYAHREAGAALSSPSPAICFLCQHPLHLVGGCSQCTCLEDSIVKNHKGVCPDCSICGKPSPLGNVCGACEAANMRGYKMEVDEISGAKSFKDWATHHFCEGFRTGQKVILKERTDAITTSPSPAKTEVEAGSQPDRQPQRGMCDGTTCSWHTLLHKQSTRCTGWKPVVAAPAESPAPPESNYLCSRCMKPVPENVPCPYCSDSAASPATEKEK